MKRSQINAAIRDAKALFARHGWALPAWADWSVAEHDSHREQSAWLAARQLGWDVTDFGGGRFAERGLTLFCVRNGIQGDAAERPYAEKLLVVGVDQETPFHMHRVKMEDIIVRGSGTLAVEFTREGSLPEFGEVRVDGALVADPCAEPVRLKTGQSVTIPRGLQHRFWGEGETVFVAEVSQCNDDFADNIFLQELPRFSKIEEDEPPLHPLWSDRVG
jgi:D-lyxose ketol-isomerase